MARVNIYRRRQPQRVVTSESKSRGSLRRGASIARSEDSRESRSPIDPGKNRTFVEADSRRFRDSRGQSDIQARTVEFQFSGIVGGFSDDWPRDRFPVTGRPGFQVDALV